MKRRKWSPELKAQIVFEGLTGKPISALCKEHRICPGQYYKWRDHLLANSSKVFEARKRGGNDANLQMENEKLKKLVGELTLALQKDVQGR
ncbi:MAG: transposase [Desulfovibrionaceae bacterium]|nr:transposase [Desulfovibrionaceae bacterium]MDD4953266.1 transposase [Desulfovibrionaceae bacterium]